VVDGWQSILSFLAAGGGGAAIAIALFKLYGSKWLESKFAKQLQEHKHAQDKEIQRLRIEIDSMLSGGLKLQERDFQILPEAWAKLHEAYTLAMSVLCPAQEDVNLNSMTTAELEDFLQKTWLSNTQKDSIRNSANKSLTFRDMKFWYKIHLADKARSDLQYYVAKHGIFFPKQIRTQFDTIVLILISALVNKEDNYDSRNYKERSEGFKQMDQEATPLYEEIESTIREHLRAHGRDKARDLQPQ